MEDAVVKQLRRRKLERVAQALRKNRMAAYVIESVDELPEILNTLIPTHSTVGTGGSMTLRQCGVLNWLKEGEFDFLDWTDVDDAEAEQLFRKTFFADVFLSSANAITENGEICNLDGDGNRVAAMIFGPKEVIIVAGYNKIVKDCEAALQRIKEVAAPLNAMRLDVETPCSLTGKCVNCRSEQRICSNYTVMGWQQKPDRIKVILVAQSMGY